jgi:outer membrane protein OmpA-like peptidoglycan-associated protein
MEMRKLFAATAVMALMALPGSAQQKDESAAKPDASAATENAASPSNASPATRGVFAVPAGPRATAFPGPQSDKKKGSQDPEAPGRAVPKYEANVGYSYMNFNPGSPFGSFNNHGVTGGLTYNVNRWLGVASDLGEYHFRRDLNGQTTKGGQFAYLFGPRFNLRRFDYFIPFAQFLVGGTHAGLPLNGDGGQNALALDAGGGVDVALTKSLAWRFAQIDYLATHSSGPALGTNHQNNLRVGTGLVYRWGFANPAPPPNHPPVAACSANPTSVYAGSNDAIAVHVNASDPDNDPLTYSYTASGGTVEGNGPDARFNTAGLAEGAYTITAKVDDGKGGTATCATDVTVAKKPHHPPTVSCATDRSPIMPGERTGITATASSPDGLPLTYSYSATSGQVTGDGPKATFDSTGLAPGSYTVKCSVNDGQPDGSRDASTSVDVAQPPPPPQPAKAGDCGYNKAGASRFDNACKRVGDDVALRLKNDPNAKLVIVGYADAKEPKAAKLAQTRADLAKKYIVEKGVDASRISSRVGPASSEKGQEKANRRVDFVVVPEGATY